MSLENTIELTKNLEDKAENLEKSKADLIRIRELEEKMKQEEGLTDDELEEYTKLRGSVEKVVTDATDI